MKINSRTDIGSTRKENQDNYWSAILNVNGKEVGIACVCDGMGGLSNGGIASSIIVSNVRDAILEGINISSIEDIIQQANNTIYTLSKNESMMGSTCTFIYCCEGKYTIYHVGDSRCYKLCENVGDYLERECLSYDHSLIAEHGITKEEEPELYKRYKNKLSRAIGVGDTVNIDKYEGMYSEGDIFLLCSDGFWHYFDEMETVSKDDLEDLDILIDKCIENGETDNITIIILEV